MAWRSYSAKKLVWAFVSLLLCFGLVFKPVGGKYSFLDVLGMVLFGGSTCLFIWEALSNSYWRKLYPEAQVNVVADEAGITVSFPEKHVVSIKWDSLQAVEIVTSDLGPFICDFHLRLIHRGGYTDIPLGAQGYDQAYHRISDLPGFDHEQAGLANCSTEIAVFKCWRRTIDHKES